MKVNRDTLRFWLLVAVLLFGAAIINGWELAGEAKTARKPLSQFPAQVGSWSKQGEDTRFDKETEKVLRADDYLSRSFESNGRVASLYIGYYLTQRNGATYHSPLNCLPGAGWIMSDGQKINITSASGVPFEANRYVIQNGSQRALMIYWYQGRGSAVASEYWAKIYTVLDSVRRRRSDGALVRVMVPLGDSTVEGEKTAVDLSAQVANELPAFVPN
jgi:EpsI family protein